MTDLITTYRSHTKSTPLSASVVDLGFLRKLFAELQSCTKKAAQIEIANYQPLSGTTPEQQAELIKKAEAAYILIVQIYGSRGEYIHDKLSEILSEENLPSKVQQVIFDSGALFNQIFKTDASNRVRVEFDFRKPRILDLLTNPSEATPNTSMIQVIGNDDTWVSGTYSKVLELCNENRRNVDWLHVTNIYDVFLWLLILPISFWSLNKINVFTDLQNRGFSNVIYVGINVYAFLFICLAFRMLFNYARWIFPKQELTRFRGRGAIVHRWILGGLILSVVASCLYDLLKAIF